MKTTKQRILSLFMAAFMVFAGMGPESLFVISAKAAETEMVILTLDAVEGTFKDDGSKIKTITLKKGETISSSGNKVPEVNPPQNQEFEGWYWYDTDMPDISGVPAEFSCKITATYKKLNDTATAKPAESEVLNDQKEETNVKEDLAAKRENVRKLLDQMDEEVRAFDTKLFGVINDEESILTGWNTEVGGKEEELNKAKTEAELDAIKDSIVPLSMEHKLNIAKTYAKKNGENSEAYKQLKTMHTDMQNLSGKIAESLSNKQYSEIPDIVKAAREKYIGMDTGALNDSKLADLLEADKKKYASTPESEIEEANNVANAKQALEASVKTLKEHIDVTIRNANYTPESVVEYQLVLVTAKKTQMNMEALLSKQDASSEQLMNGKAAVEQCIQALETAKNNLKLDTTAQGSQDVATAKGMLQAEVTSLEAYLLEQTIDASYYTPDSIYRYDHLKAGVIQELQKAKMLLEEKDPTFDSLHSQWWNLSYAHSALKNSTPMLLVETGASDLDVILLKEAIHKLEAVINSVKDTTKATPDSLAAYTNALKVAEGELAKARELSNDQKATKMAVKKMEDSLSLATDALEKAKTELVISSDSSNKRHYNRSSDSSSSATTYTVTVKDATGGNATSSVKTSAPGKTVTITATPKDGYATKSLTITDKNGKSVSTTEKNGVYTFSMPASNVTVMTVFAKSVANPFDTGVASLLQTVDHIQYINGYSDGTVGPERNMTRGEVAQMFYNLLLNKNVPVTKTFLDVPDTMWCFKAVNTLASLGVISGYSTNEYGPNDAITREQFCAIAVRFATKIKVGDMEYTMSFTDINSSDWSYDSIMTAASLGWINGYSNDIFGSSDKITRAQVMTIVNHMLGRSADQSFVDTATDIKSFTDLSKSHWAYYDIMEATNAHNHTMNGISETWSGLQ